MTDMEAPRRRFNDRSNVEARQAISDTVGRFAAWRADLARFAVRIERGYTPVEQQEMLARCAAIGGEVLAARIELIASLADAPRRVAGHSRVTDVEKALDGIEATLATIQRRLAAPAG